MIYTIFLDYGQQNIFKKHEKLIFPVQKNQVNLKIMYFFNVPDHGYHGYSE